MKIFVPNLKRRPDKKAAMETCFRKYGHTDVTFIASHDAKDYASIMALLNAMRNAGWELQDLNKLKITDILGEKDQARIPIRILPHIAFRWTYLDILRGIVETDTEALILIDDMCLPFPPADYDKHIVYLKSVDGDILGLDPIVQDKEAYLLQGYTCPTEEAVFYTPEGAAGVIPLLLETPEKVIGDVIRHRYPENKVWTTARLMARSIGKKSDWDSDIHINSDSIFR